VASGDEVTVARRRGRLGLPARSGGRRARGVCAQLFPGLTPTSETSAFGRRSCTPPLRRR